MPNTIITPKVFTFDWTDSSSKYLSAYDADWLQHESDIECKFWENADGTFSATLTSDELDAVYMWNGMDESEMFDSIEQTAKQLIREYDIDTEPDWEEPDNDGYWEWYDMLETAAIERFYGAE